MGRCYILEMRAIVNNSADRFDEELRDLEASYAIPSASLTRRYGLELAFSMNARKRGDRAAESLWNPRLLETEVPLYTIGASHGDCQWCGAKEVAIAKTGCSYGICRPCVSRAADECTSAGITLEKIAIPAGTKRRFAGDSCVICGRPLETVKMIVQAREGARICDARIFDASAALNG